MDPQLDMDKIYLMARGIMVQLSESVDHQFDVTLVTRFQATLDWLEAQALQIEGYAGTKQLIHGWREAVGRQHIQAADVAKRVLEEDTAGVPRDF